MNISEHVKVKQHVYKSFGKQYMVYMYLFTVHYEYLYICVLLTFKVNEICFYIGQNVEVS